MKIHHVLLRQLKKCNLSELSCPEKLEQWQNFLERVDLAYQDHDQDRYMTERSQDVSSREMHELNNNLNDAERIAHIGSWVHDLKTNRVRGSNEANSILNRDVTSPILQFENFLELIHNDDRVMFENTITNAIQHGTRFDLEIRVNLPNSIKWLCIHGRPIFGKDNHIVEKLHGTVMDITEYKQANEKIRSSEAKYRKLVELSPYGILVLVKERIVFINKAMIKILNGENEAQFIGKPFFDIVHPSFHEVVKNKLTNIKTNFLPDEVYQETYIALDGQEKIVEVMPIPFEFENEAAVQIIVHDISARIQAENRISYLSLHDPITELLNKKSLYEFLDSSIVAAKRNDNDKIVVMFINMDRFKSINETMGLTAGDLLLQSAAKRLKKLIKPSHGLGRMEGDQFAIIFAAQSAGTDEIARFAKEINAAMARPFIVRNQPVVMSSSIGISVFPDDGDDPEALFKSANIALRFTKENGGNNYHFCTKELHNRIIIASSLEVKLRQAITNNELYLEYQPKVLMSTGEITGLEALLRWKDPVSGINIPPSEFIPLAEELSLISPITEVVLNLIANQMAVWQHEKLPIFRVAINLSPYNFHEMNLVDIFEATLKKYQLRADLFEIEIIETAFFQGIASNIEVLKMLKKMGIKVSIDDFGMGYSSLSYLQYLEVDTLKIDQIFIQNINTNPTNPALVSAIIAMAHGLNIKVVAEGIESEAEFVFLREHGCDEAQGYYISRPMSPEKLIDFIKKTVKHTSDDLSS